MKTALLVGLAFSCSTAFAQSELVERTYFNSDENTTWDLVVHPLTGELLHLRVTEAEYNRAGETYATTPDGSPLWNTDLGGGVTTHAIGVAPSGEIAVLGNDQASCYWPGNQGYLKVFDAAGNELENHYLYNGDWTFEYMDSETTSVGWLSEDLVLFALAEQWMILDRTTGELAANGYLDNLWGRRRILSLPNGGALLIHDAGVVHWDAAGTLTPLSTPDWDFRDAVLYGDLVLVLTSTEMHWLGVEDAAVLSTASVPDNFTPRALDIGEVPGLLGATPEGFELALWNPDTDLFEVVQSWNNEDGLNLRTVAHAAGTWYVAGEVIEGPSAVAVLMGWDGTLGEYLPDAEATSIAWSQEDVQLQSGEEYWILNVEVTVTNTGVVPLEGVSVFAQSPNPPGEPYCHEWMVSMTSDTTLAPGESAVLVLPNPVVASPLNPGTSEAPEFEVCAWVLGPDQKRDVYPANNLTCVTQTSTHIAPQKEVVMWYDSAAECVHGVQGEWQLRGLSGRLLLQGEATGEVQLPDLAPGCFVLVTAADRLRFVRP